MNSGNELKNHVAKRNTYPSLKIVKSRSTNFTVTPSSRVGKKKDDS